VTGAMARVAMAPVTSRIAARRAQLLPAQTQETAMWPFFFASPLSRPSDHEKTSNFNSKDSSVLGGRAQRNSQRRIVCFPLERHAFDFALGAWAADAMRLHHKAAVASEVGEQRVEFGGAEPDLFFAFPRDCRQELA
jgi:hypothetical protein